MQPDKKNKSYEPFPPENTPVPPQVMDPSEPFQTEELMDEPNNRKIKAEATGSDTFNGVITVDPEY